MAWENEIMHLSQSLIPIEPTWTINKILTKFIFIIDHVVSYDYMAIYMSANSKKPRKKRVSKESPWPEKSLKRQLWISLVKRVLMPQRLKISRKNQPRQRHILSAFCGWRGSGSCANGRCHETSYRMSSFLPRWTWNPGRCFRTFFKRPLWLFYRE